MEEKDLFQIGEVAKLFHLNVSSLRHYEEKGILIPEVIDPNSGYRYYSTRQFEVLNTIRYLRALDLPLDQIADFVSDRDLDRIEEKLRRQKETVIARQKELARIERKIDNRLRQIEDARHSELEEIREVTMPACRLVRVEGTLIINGAEDMEPPIRKLEQSQQEALIFLGKVGLGISAEHLEAGEFAKYDSIFLMLDAEDQYEGKVAELPETRSVSIRFCGSHTEAPSRYEQLLAYMKEHRYPIGGFSREITMIDYGLTKDAKEFVTEISIPIGE